MTEPTQAGLAKCRTCSRPRGENIAGGTRCARCGHRQNVALALSLAIAVGVRALAGGAPARDAISMAGAVLLAFAPAAVAAVLFHELVHALTARLLGQTVTRTIVGEGRLLARLGRRAPLMFGSVIVGNGMTYVADVRPRAYRLRWMCLLMTAPVCSLLAGVLLWDAASTWPEIARAAARTFAGAHLFLALISCIPVPTFGGRVWSDLAATLMLLRADPAELEEHRAQNAGIHVLHLLDIGEPAEALATAGMALAAAPRSPAAHTYLAYALHATGRHDEAREAARTGLRLPMGEADRAHLARFLEQGPAVQGAGVPMTTSSGDGPGEQSACASAERG